MTHRLRISTALSVAAASTLFASALFAATPVQAFPAPASPAVPASPGQNCAAGYMADPNSGNCWQMTDKGSPTVGGGPCLPGRVGTCLGYLHNNPYAPGDTLPGNNSGW